MRRAGRLQHLHHTTAINNLSSEAFAARHYPRSTSSKSSILALGPTNASDVSIQLKSRADVTRTEIKACFDLVEQTSSDDYRTSSNGWDPEHKMEEMSDSDMKYLLVTHESAETSEESKERIEIRANADESYHPYTADPTILSAFLSFMITIEDGLPVLYVYELHTAPAARRQGLGKQLVSNAMSIAQSTKMHKVMLTVFLRNEGARKFYERCGFELDEYSPKDIRLRGGKVKQADYQILSKRVG